MHRSRIVAMIAAGVAVLALVAAQAPADEEEAVEETADCRLIRGADTPDDPSDDVEVCEQQVWFHRSETPIGNLSATDVQSFPRWDTTQPHESVTAGAGGGYVGVSLADQFAPGDPNNAATFEGAFTGDIDNIAVTLYAFIPGRSVTETNHNLHAILYVDNMQFAAIDQGDVEVETTPGGDAVLRVQFAFTDLYDYLQFFVDEVGPDVEHTLRLQLGAWNYGRDEVMYVYDTTEVPSGIVFNATDLSDYTQISMG